MNWTTLVDQYVFDSLVGTGSKESFVCELDYTVFDSLKITSS